MRHKLVLIAGIAMTYLQGYRARSWIEYSLLKKCVYLTIRSTMDGLKPLSLSDTSCSSLSTSSSYSCSQVPIGNWSATSPIRLQRFLRNWLRHYNGDLHGKYTFTGNVFAGLMLTATGISSSLTSSYKGLALCLFNYSTSGSSFPVRLCGCLSLVHLEVCSISLVLGVVPTSSQILPNSTLPP